MPLTQGLERVLWVFGFVCLGWAGATCLDAYQFQRDQGRVLAEQTTAMHNSTAAPRDTLDPSAPIGRLDIPLRIVAGDFQRFARIGIQAIAYVDQRLDDTALSHWLRR